MSAFLSRAGLGAQLLGAAAVALFAPHAVAAQTFRLTLVNDEAAVGCVDQAELERSVAERLGYQPFEAGAGSTIVVHVTSRDTSLGATIEVVADDHRSLGTRELATDGASCEELVRALTLSLSIAIDPDRALAQAPPPAAVPEQASTESSAPLSPSDDPAVASEAPAATTSTPNTDQPASQPPRPAAFVGSVAALSFFGVAPSPAYGLQLMIHRRWGPFSVGGGGRLARSAWSDVDDGARLHTTVGVGELQACWQARVVYGCAVGLLGASWVRADEVDMPRTDVGAFGAIGIGVGAEVTLSRSLSLVAAGDVLAVSSPVEAEVDGAAVWRAPPMVATLLVGVRSRIW